MVHMQTALKEKERASTQKCWQVIFSCETPEQHMLVQQIMLPKIECSQAFKSIIHGHGDQTATKRQLMVVRFFCAVFARPQRVNTTHKSRSVSMIVKRCTTREVFSFSQGQGSGPWPGPAEPKPSWLGLGQPWPALTCLKAGHGWPWPALGSL